MKKHNVSFYNKVLKLLLFIFVSVSVSNSLAQKALLDSLKRNYNSTDYDSARIINLLWQAEILMRENTIQADSIINEAIKYCNEINDENLLVRSYNHKSLLYYIKGKYDKCIHQLLTNLDLAKKNDFAFGISESLLYLGSAYLRKGDYNKAEYYQLENLKFSIKVHDLDGQASSYNNLGNISEAKGDYTKALEYYTLSHKAYEQDKYDFGQAITLGNIGIVQNELKNFDKALFYFEKSYILYSKIQNKREMNFILKNIGEAYRNKGELGKAKKNYKNALKYFKSVNDLYNEKSIYFGLGKTFMAEEKFDSARVEYAKSLKLSKQLGDSTNIGSVNYELGLSYLKENEGFKARNHMLLAKKIANDIKNPIILMKTEKELHPIYQKLKNYKSAYESFANYISIRDSLQGIDKMKLAEELEAKFQNEKKEKEIALLNSKNEINALQIERRENERNYLVAIILAVMVLLFALLNQNKIKNKANKKLNELNKLQSSFFTNISHEFRTPLTLILAAIDQKSEEDNDINRNNTIVQKNANRLLQLINQLLELSKLEAGSESLQVTEVCVSEFVMNLASSFSSWAESKSIIFNLEISPSDINGYIDTDKLQKIVYNLLSNSFKFTPEGGTVTIRSVNSGNQFSLEIFDNGIGMSTEALNNIFQKFYQVDSADNRGFEGSGIGLAITKELVELHKGNIFVSSEENIGTSFMITIPLKGYKQSEISIDKKTPNTELQEIENSKDDGYIPSQVCKENIIGTQEFMILLVEDNPDLLNYLKENLDENYKIISAFDGKEGYEMAQEHIPDLIISDLMMPVMDGREMSRKVRVNEKTSHIPIIMLTAKADAKSKLEGLEIGADDYLTKPFDFKELKIKIRNILLQRNRLHEHIKGQFFFPDPKLTANDKFLKKASEIIEENISNADFTVNEFQQEMGFSRMQLHRKIKALTGHSANEFIRLTRLKKATMLLEKGYDQVSQIAFETGFNSPSYFSKCFKKAYGINPKEYLEKHNKGKLG